MSTGIFLFSVKPPTQLMYWSRFVFEERFLGGDFLRLSSAQCYFLGNEIFTCENPSMWNRINKKLCSSPSIGYNCRCNLLQLNVLFFVDNCCLKVYCYQITQTYCYSLQLCYLWCDVNSRQFMRNQHIQKSNCTEGVLIFHFKNTLILLYSHTKNERIYNNPQTFYHIFFVVDLKASINPSSSLDD